MEQKEFVKNARESSESENEEMLSRCEIKRNRRKNLTPQKAVQSETNNCIVTIDTKSIEIGQPDTISIENNSNEADYYSENSSSMSESEFLSNICNEEILKELQKNPVNEELMKELNEEDIFSESKGIKSLEAHVYIKTKEEYHSYRSVKCNMCEEVFPLKADFDQHYSQSYNLPPVYTCTFCNKTSEKYSTFRAHCYRHITEGRFKCNNCSKVFNLKSLLHVHILAKHSTVKPFSCELCGKKFVTKSGLRIHQNKHKSDTREDYPCVICGKILHSRGGLTSHMNVHRLGRRFMCDLCGKTFTQKANMQQHVKQHTGDKPHVCDRCGKTFVEKSHLVRHYSVHSNERLFKCDICEKMYKTERCLKVHSLVHATERPFVCKLCSKGFLSSTKLKQHSNIHTGERPFSCKYCERTFTNYPNLLKHTRRKHQSETSTGNNTVLLDQPPVSDEDTLINIPLINEKYDLSQPYDLTGANVLIPYQQNSIPSHQSLMQHIDQQASMSNQLSELIHILQPPCNE